MKRGENKVARDKYLDKWIETLNENQEKQIEKIEKIFSDFKEKEYLPLKSQVGLNSKSILSIKKDVAYIVGGIMIVGTAILQIVVPVIQKWLGV